MRIRVTDVNKYRAAQKVVAFPLPLFIQHFNMRQNSEHGFHCCCLDVNTESEEKISIQRRLKMGILVGLSGRWEGMWGMIRGGAKLEKGEEQGLGQILYGLDPAMMVYTRSYPPESFPAPFSSVTLLVQV